jgi:hypothetical protein
MKHLLFLTLMQIIFASFTYKSFCQTDRQKYDDFVFDKKSKASEKYTYSQFAIALRYKDTLQLTTSQVDIMYLEVQNLKDLKNAHYREKKESLDTRSLESSKLVNLLTATQYNLLLRLKNHSKAKSMAESDWKELEVRGLTSSLQKDQTISALYEYYIQRESLYDKYRHDPIQQSEQTKAHYNSNRPVELKTLTKARRSNQNNTLGQNLNGN